jgi:LAO/AO transport system kinase
LARLLSVIEDGSGASAAVARLTYRTTPPYVVGLTGPPGAGKSTLVDQLVSLARQGWPGAPDEPARPVDAIGVLAVDPSSPMSGGAFLADRVRMQRHADDEGVFIRSMATRGHLGGLSRAVPDAVRALGAAGIGLVVIETVGVGQIEVEVAAAADTTIVVVNPGWGDSLQAAKAGLLEVADIFVVNKADRPGASEAATDLSQMLALNPPDGWTPPIVETVGVSGEGIDTLLEEVARHRRYLEDTGSLAARRADRARHELERVVAARLDERFFEVVASARFAEAVQSLAAGTSDPYEMAEQLIARS